MRYITVEQRGRARRLGIDNPKKLNALSSALLAELSAALDAAEQDDGVGAMIIGGTARAFAAGVDIGELRQMQDAAAVRQWQRLASCRKPVIAAVAGVALGGGCELAMMCDFIIAGQSARFAQPEIKLATIPGMGGTQRLPRAVGKAAAMEMCLTGRMVGAAEAQRSGLVARVVADDALEEEAWQTAAVIAGYSLPAVCALKAAVNAAAELPLAAGLQRELQLFDSTFALADRGEGMAAFVEKRAPAFKHR